MLGVWGRFPRAASEFRRALPRFAYFPFGGGQHQCIGEGFAWMEAKIALATLCRRWRATTGARAELLPRTTLEVKGGMPATLHRRR